MSFWSARSAIWQRRKTFRNDFFFYNDSDEPILVGKFICRWLALSYWFNGWVVVCCCCLEPINDKHKFLMSEEKFPSQLRNVLQRFQLQFSLKSSCWFRVFSLLVHSINNCQHSWRGWKSNNASCEGELMPSRVFHYFRPSLNANVFLFLVTLAVLLFTTNTFFFYVNPLSLWLGCNGRYFYILLLSTMLWIKSIFISDFSASSPCALALQEGKIEKSLLENLRGGSLTRPMQFAASKP